MSRFEAEWRRRFERFARTYTDEAEISGWSEAGLIRRVARFGELLPALGLPSRAAALDLGCGAGTYVRLLAGLGHRAIGLDYSTPSLARAAAADPGGKGQYLAGEAYALPFSSARFDLVVSIGVLQTLEQPERALDEMARVLRPGGVLVVEALNGRAITSLARRLGDGVRGRATRVRAWPPSRVRGWLAARGLACFHEAPILLPPRRLSALGRGARLGTVARALDAAPRLAVALAHSFLFVARRQPSLGARP
jgi:SAM-dependent methyltransferase